MKNVGLVVVLTSLGTFLSAQVRAEDCAEILRHPGFAELVKQSEDAVSRNDSLDTLNNVSLGVAMAGLATFYTGDIRGTLKAVTPVTRTLRRVGSGVFFTGLGGIGYSGLAREPYHFKSPREEACVLAQARKNIEARAALARKQQPICNGYIDTPAFEAKAQALRTRLDEAKQLDNLSLLTGGTALAGTILVVAPEFGKGARNIFNFRNARGVGAAMMGAGLAGTAGIEYGRSRDGIPAFGDGAEQFCAYARAQDLNDAPVRSTDPLSSDSLHKALSEAQQDPAREEGVMTYSGGATARPALQ